MNKTFTHKIRKDSSAPSARVLRQIQRKRTTRKCPSYFKVNFLLQDNKVLSYLVLSCLVLSCLNTNSRDSQCPCLPVTSLLSQLLLYDSCGLSPLKHGALQSRSFVHCCFTSTANIDGLFIGTGSCNSKNRCTHTYIRKFKVHYLLPLIIGAVFCSR